MSPTFPGCILTEGVSTESTAASVFTLLTITPHWLGIPTNSHLSTCCASRPVLPLAYLLIQKTVFPISPHEASLGTDLEPTADPLGSRRRRGLVLGKKNVDACFTLSFQIEISVD